MGHNQYSRGGGVIPYPTAPVLGAPGARYPGERVGAPRERVPPRLYENIGPVYENSSLLEPSVTSRHSRQPDMISTSRSPGCLFQEHQQLNQRQQLEEQLQLLQLKMLQNKLEHLKGLELMQQTSSPIQDLLRNPAVQSGTVLQSAAPTFPSPFIQSSSSFPSPSPFPPTSTFPSPSPFLISATTQSVFHVSPGFDVSSTPSSSSIPSSSTPSSSTPSSVLSAPRQDASARTDLSVLESTRNHLAECGWYHGNLSWEESNSLLTNTQEGTFLLRDSRHPGTMYSLSVNRAGKLGPTSIRIHFTGGMFKLDADGSIRNLIPAFSSMTDLIQFYTEKDSPLISEKKADEKVSISVSAPIVLKKPFYKAPPSLAHLARLAVNKQLGEGGRAESLQIPPKLQQFINAYPSSI